MSEMISVFALLISLSTAAWNIYVYKNEQGCIRVGGSLREISEPVYDDDVDRLTGMSRGHQANIYLELLVRNVGKNPINLMFGELRLSCPDSDGKDKYMFGFLGQNSIHLEQTQFARDRTTLHCEVLVKGKSLYLIDSAEKKWKLPHKEFKKLKSEAETWLENRPDRIAQPNES